MLDLVWDRVYPIPLPPFPLHPSAAPPGWASRIWLKTLKPNRLCGRFVQKPRTLTKVPPEGHFGIHLGSFGQSVVGLRALDPGLRSSGTRLQTLKFRFLGFGPQTSKSSIPGDLVGPPALKSRSPALNPRSPALKPRSLTLKILSPASKLRIPALRPHRGKKKWLNLFATSLHARSGPAARSATPRGPLGRFIQIG